MPPRASCAAILAAACSISTIVHSSPTLTFPVNSQIPPVARVSEQYNFVFSSSTFVTVAAEISYFLENQPDWLVLDGPNRRLAGTPGAKDIGASGFQLVAQDRTGQSASNITLVVVQTHGPRLGQPLGPQLARFGRTSSPESLYLYPLQTFSFSFAADTFEDTTSATQFYAQSSNNTPLPNWIQFESTSLSFSGIAPPLVSPGAAPQTYSISLVASNVPGFAEATANFQLIVGYHVLAFASPSITFNITPGKLFQSPSLLNSLTLDGTEVVLSELNSVTATISDWLAFDVDTIQLSGTPPSNVLSEQIFVSASDVLGDTANTSIHLLVDNAIALWIGDLPNLNATIGGHFNYMLNPLFLSQAGVRVTAQLGNASNWLSFDGNTLTFSGIVPLRAPTGTTKIELTASQGQEIQSKIFNLTLVKSSHFDPSTFTTSPTRTALSSSHMPTSSKSAVPPESHVNLENNKLDITNIVLAVILPILGLALISLLFLRCRQRRRAQRNQKSASRDRIASPPFRNQIGVPREHDTPSTHGPPRSIRRVTPTGPPQIELPWAPNSLRTSRNRISKRMRAPRSDSLNSSWADMIVPTLTISKSNSRHGTDRLPPPSSMLELSVPLILEGSTNYSRKRPPLRTIQPKQADLASKRASKVMSAISLASTGLPKQLSGAGHGAGGIGRNDIRSSWQTTLGSMVISESPDGMTALESFPSPPREAAAAATAPSRLRDATVCLVRNDSNQSESLEAQRQRWHTRRAQDRLEGAERFSSSWSSRLRSSSRLLVDASLSPGRILSTLNEREGSNGRQQSWSQWSTVGAAAQLEFAADELHPDRTAAESRLERETSGVSSGQFSSALSSGSQWEDENLIEEDGAGGQRLWQTTPRPDERATPSPRLPFEPANISQENLRDGDSARRFRLADNRRSISMDKRDLQRSQRSHQGSLRFV